MKGMKTKLKYLEAQVNNSIQGADPVREGRHTEHDKAPEERPESLGRAAEMKFWPLSLVSFAIFALTYLYPEQSFKIVLRPELYLAPTSGIVPFNLEMFAIRMISLCGFVPYSVTWLKGWLFRRSRQTFVYLSLFGIESCFLWFEYMEFLQGASIPGFGGISSAVFYQGFATPIIFAIPNLVLPTLILLVRLKIVQV